MVKRFLIRIIRGYQKYISPGLGNHCKYLPTCSQYMIDALEKYGVFKGLMLGKKDYVEKVLRLGEDRSFPHEAASRDFGYEPEPFETGLKREVEEYLAHGRG